MTVEQKWQQIKDGKRVVATDKDMTFFESQPEWQRLASIKNPKQVGTKDNFLAFLVGVV